ncbi:MAG: hypothetical protein M1839_000562 [Geoglossum umbratile]|nr:MAG: hypothetical protein M1839_000562 [Geoglossum umbratile]
MASLSDERKATISKYPIGRRLSGFLKRYSEFVSELPSRPSCSEITSEAITGPVKFKGADRLIEDLLLALQTLDAARELPPHHGSSNIAEAITTILGHAIAEPVNEESLWSAVYDLFRPVPPPRSNTISPSSHTPFLRDLHSDWNGEFFEDPLIGLRQQMKDCISGPLPYYAKTLVFVQSSGMGKSRLADNFGTTCPMINFILRKGSVGYPPTDSEIQQFMCQEMPEDLLNTVRSSPPKEHSTYPPSKAAIIWNHSVMFGILKASFKIFNVWVEGQTCTETCLEKLANIRHEEMKSSDTNGTGDTSSQKRIDFCHQVKQKACEIARSLVMDREWRKLFNDEEESAVRQAMGGSKQVKKLLSVVERLTNSLKKFPRENQSNDHLLVIVFDEAASLFSPSGLSRLDSGRYIALNRICSLLKDYPLWFFFLSTESKVEKILPTDNPIPANEGEVLDYSNVPSSQYPSKGDGEIKLRVFPAFVSFPLDIEDRSRMRNPVSKKEELAKSMADFSQPKHMAMFGRRLWYAYSNPQDMYNVARLKLVGGRENATYDSDNENHVFAALSFRLSLDPCLENSMSLPLVRTAVGSFMRVVISINQPTGNLHTVTPSEPILAKAAMEHLCAGNWSKSIRTLSQKLLQQGLIEKGLQGELFARLVLILAHDSIRRRAAIPGDPDRIDLGRMLTFTVEKFLTALYAEDHESISKIDP